MTGSSKTVSSPDSAAQSGQAAGMLSAIKRRISPDVKKRLRRWLGVETPSQDFVNVYEQVFETGAQADASDEAVGKGNYELTGSIE
jgi:hypothetical protein